MTFAIPLTNKLQSLTKSCHLYSSLITCNFCRRECSLVPVLKEIQKIIGLPPYDVWEHLLPVSECYRTMFSIDCDLYLQCSSGFPTTFFLHKKIWSRKEICLFSSWPCMSTTTWCWHRTAILNGCNDLLCLVAVILDDICILHIMNPKAGGSDSDDYQSDCGHHFHFLCNI